MAIFVKNTKTGEINRISYLWKTETGSIYFCNRNFTAPGAQFLKNWNGIITVSDVPETGHTGHYSVALCDGWELTTQGGKTGAKGKAPQPVINPVATAIVALSQTVTRDSLLAVVRGYLLDRVTVDSLLDGATRDSLLAVVRENVTITGKNNAVAFNIFDSLLDGATRDSLLAVVRGYLLDRVTVDSLLDGATRDSLLAVVRDGVTGLDNSILNKILLVLTTATTQDSDSDSAQDSDSDSAQDSDSDSAQDSDSDSAQE